MNFLLQLWECGIEQCKELCRQHETITYDYVRLAELHVSGYTAKLALKTDLYAPYFTLYFTPFSPY